MYGNVPARFVFIVRYIFALTMYVKRVLIFFKVSLIFFVSVLRALSVQFQWLRTELEIVVHESAGELSRADCQWLVRRYSAGCKTVRWSYHSFWIAFFFQTSTFPYFRCTDFGDHFLASPALREWLLKSRYSIGEDQQNLNHLAKNMNSSNSAYQLVPFSLTAQPNLQL